MRAFLNAFWSTLIAVLKGVNEYAETFEASGRTCKRVVMDFENELMEEGELRKVEFQRKLQQRREALAIEVSAEQPTS